MILTSCNKYPVRNATLHLCFTLKKKLIINLVLYSSMYGTYTTIWKRASRELSWDELDRNMKPFYPQNEKELLQSFKKMETIIKPKLSQFFAKDLCCRDQG